MRFPRPAPPRLFDIERLIYSAANYRFMLVADVMGAALLMAVGALRFRGPLVLGIAIVASGFLAWGGVEYALHRWVLHGRPSIAARAHARHHADPGAPISSPALMSSALAAAAYFTLSTLFDAGASALAVSGVYAGYNYYALLHHLLHGRRALLERVPSLARLEESHRIHHRRVAVNFGVSSTLWDRLMGSYQPTRPSTRRGTA